MRATRTELERLWADVLAALLGYFNKASKRPPVEALGVARQFLRDQGVGRPSLRDRKHLEALHRLYSARLAEAMQSERIPAAVLAECRKWIEYHGIRADIPTAVARQVAQKLADGSLPFTSTTKH